jgi:hypothetical protein
MENMGLGEKEEKPFWAKFLRNDYMQDNEDRPLLPDVMDVLEGNKNLDELTGPKNDGMLALYEPQDD